VKAVPHSAQFLSVGKPGQRLAQKGRLPAEVGAAVANEKVQAQRYAFGEAEAPVEPLGNEAGSFLAGEHHLAIQWVGRSRNPLQAPFTG
jgi:hypothetical protein